MKPRHSGPEDSRLHSPALQPVATTGDVSDTDEVLSRRRTAASLICRIVAAGIMCETLWFKFTGHPESVWIFTRMNLEAWWRYGQGVWELAASVLLFVPRWKWLGAMLTLGAMGAAILSHLAVLGIAVRGDGGLLFGMACTAFVSALTVLWIHQQPSRASRGWMTVRSDQEWPR